jgi:hypothetical protein
MEGFSIHAYVHELVAATHPLSEDEKAYVVTHWLEPTTPLSVAHELARTVTGDRVIELGAGIGRVSWACRQRYGRWIGQPAREIVCVEPDARLVDVGRRVLPDATWICGDVADATGLGSFGTAIVGVEDVEVARGLARQLIVRPST